MYRVILKSAFVLAATSFLTLPVNAVEVYLFKGAGDFSVINKNLHFSRGLERMADTLNAEGIHSQVRAFQSVDDALATIRKRKPESVAFIGHSMGALASMSIARQMKHEGIRVAYVGLIDIPGPVGIAGRNVEWVENFYSLHPVYGRLTNVSSHPKAENIHVAGYIHTRMDDAPKVKSRMLAAIRKIQADETIQQEQFNQPIPWEPQVLPEIQSVQNDQVQVPQVLTEPVYVETTPIIQYEAQQVDTPHELGGVPSIKPNVDLTNTGSITNQPYISVVKPPRYGRKRRLQSNYLSRKPDR